MKRIAKIGILACLFTLTTTATLHAQDFEWAKSFGGTSYDYCNFITLDAVGNIYTTGYYEGTVDFDPGAGTLNLTSTGFTDVFVQKLDASGNFLWAKSFGGINNDYGSSIAVDAVGNVYIAGRFEGTADFDPGASTSNHTAVGQGDIFVQKLDVSGNFLWAKSFGGTSFDVASSISVDALGNVYTTGTFNVTVDFDPGGGTSNLTSAGTNDVFVHKLDPSGNFLWAKSFGSNVYDLGNFITLDPLGNLYITGNFWGTVDFDPGAGISNLTSVGFNDIFILKLDASGNLLWAKSFGGTSYDYGYSIAADAVGNIYTTGYFESTVDFDPGAGTLNLTSTGAADIFVQKLDASGNFLWAKSFGSTAEDIGYSIASDALGNVYTTGRFQGTTDFDPGTGTLNLTSAGSADFFVQKLDASGDFVWAKSFGGTAFDFATSITLDASGNIYTTGIYSETVDFDPGAGVANLTVVGFNDIFVQKMSQCMPTSGADVQTTCDFFTWIDGNTYTASNNTATHTLTNIAGCDSVVTLDLTVNSVSDMTTIVNGLTITATNSNALYQWLDCNNNYSIIANETNQNYTATINGSYAVELTENGCVDTSNCLLITNVGIVENSFGESFVTHPNPTNGSFSVNLGNNYDDITISITDINGKLIQSLEYKNSQTLNLNIAEPMGVYIMIIKSGEQRAIIKLVKQ